ncbi:MAG TPA: VWA domain-containing protein [Xanthobacteraceae bacterium]|nr:VWA domain-containing protein [Xanthobacteraceae bacterium]
MSETQSSVDPLIRNPNQRTPCVLVLDCSGSMTAAISGESRISQLNAGLRLLEQDLKADAMAKTRVQLAIVCVGGVAGDNNAATLLDWTDAVDFQAFPLKASGYTPLGKGMLLALQMLRDQVLAYQSRAVNSTRPWIMLLTDGEPTDDDEWSRACAACRAAEQAGECVIFPIGVGEANMDKLQKVSATQAKELTQTKFRELFVWISGSVRSASRSRPGDRVQLPSTDTWAAVKA